MNVRHEGKNQNDETLKRWLHLHTITIKVAAKMGKEA